jgi:predicted nucleotidyltransferase
MAEGCFEAIERSFKRAAGALAGARVEFMLGGSLAIWVRGGPESCNDLDLMLRKEDSGRALEALQAAGMRTERPPEGWLVKARDGDVLIDLISEPIGIPIDDEAFERADEVSAWGVHVRAMSLEDVMVSKLLALHEHALDFEDLLQIARSLRESIDWPQVRARTADSPYARAFFALLTELGLVTEGGAAPGATARQRRVRVASSIG